MILDIRNIIQENMRKKVSDYNVEYHCPGKSDRSAMPLGNGETALSVWMTEQGKLQFYIARTDALTELERTVKLGMAELEISPGFCEKKTFLQRLDLERGYIVFDNEHSQIVVWVDSESDMIYVKGVSEDTMDVRARYYTWRKEKHVPCKNSYAWLNIPEAADIVETQDNNIVFYHQNGENGLKQLAELQCVEDGSSYRDAVTNRIFGGIMNLQDGICDGEWLKKDGTKEFLLKIAVHSEQVSDTEEWYQEVLKKLKAAKTAEDSLAGTADFWKKFWDKSYIYIHGDIKRKAEHMAEGRGTISEPMECSDTESNVTRGYLLTKFMQACCKDGKFPIWFNGYLFNLCPGQGKHFEKNELFNVFTFGSNEEYPTLEINPDERSWCDEHLWQNLRWPYYSMLAQGEFESLKKMFNYYKGFAESNRIRAKKFYGAEGLHNTELTLISGLQSERAYGADRTGKPDGWAVERLGGNLEISPGLELLKLMLEYYRYTQEEDFIYSDILPYAKELFRYIETRFKERKDGKLVISHLNSVETYFDTVNPTTVVAGMHSVLKDILALEGIGEYREYFEEIAEILPDLPTGEWKGKTVILPAGKYEEIRHNVESPEFYAIYPFALCGRYVGNEELGINTFVRANEISGAVRPFILGETPGAPSYSGWQYIGHTAAMLGMREVCREILENNCAMQNPGNRFPAMWGPVYDAVPDTDHGSNIMNLLQMMAMQCVGEKIYLLPALPEGWDVKFRLFAPYKTIVECEYREGKLEAVKVVPESRRKDIVLTV